jgi:hypothetical protein
MLNLFTVISLSLILYLLLIWKAGNVFPILYLFLFVYFVQYVFSVYLIYNEYPALEKQMPIPQEVYFNYTLTAVTCLFAGVFLFNRDVQIAHLLKKVDPVDAERLGHILLVISFFFDFVLGLGFSSLASIVSFTNYLKYAGALCYFFSPSLRNYGLIAFVYVWLVRDALVGIFIDFFIWSTFFFFIVSLRFQFSMKVRVFFIIVALPIVILIQTIKHEYRRQVWSGKKEASVGLITDIAEKRQENAPLLQTYGVISTVGRLNQGWHLGKTLKWVPSKQPIMNGKDMWEDIVGSILPRIFFVDKKIIGSKDKFKKFTGHQLTKSTSMTIGVLGDFYVNFGRTGSFIGLFIFGAVMARLIYFFIKKHVIPNPINIIWIPFLFSYLVRANNDFYVVINSFVKGYLVFLFVSYVKDYLFPSTKMYNRTNQ